MLRNLMLRRSGALTLYGPPEAPGPRATNGCAARPTAHLEVRAHEFRALARDMIKGFNRNNAHPAATPKGAGLVAGSTFSSDGVLWLQWRALCPQAWMNQLVLQEVV